MSSVKHTTKAYRRGTPLAPIGKRRKLNPGDAIGKDITILYHLMDNRWQCRCSCGQECEKTSSQLKAYLQPHCGCKKAERKAKAIRWFQFRKTG